MDFLKNFEWTPMNLLKVAAVVLIGVIMLSVVSAILKPTLDSMRSYGGVAGSMPMIEPSYGGYGMEEDSAYLEKGITLSARNIASPMPATTPGADAEAYEVTDYGFTYETGSSERECGSIKELKALDYVVFEHANEYDGGCSYRFKVAHAQVASILDILRDLDPKDSNESTYSIKNQVTDFTSEEDILTKKLRSIDETLTGALSAYDDLTDLATRTQNVDTLAKIIDSKLSVIERLTAERLSTAAQLDRLARAKATELDRLEYTYFSANVYERKYVDGEQIAESWKEALRTFVYDVNKTLQDLTLHLIALLLLIVQYAVYVVILFIVAKNAWKYGSKYWKA